jgi:hypothetical protein
MSNDQEADDLQEGSDGGNDQARAEAAATERRRQPPMSLVDQQRLRAIFVTKEAQSWSRLEKKKYVDEILIHKLFKHLNKSQVKRRLNLFFSEIFLRKKYSGELALDSGEQVFFQVLQFHP